MAAPKKPYESFGPFILFKKLETDSHGELWRAGKIDGGALGATVALRRFTSGSRVALMSAIEDARPVLAQLHGTSFARDQVAGTIDGVPYIAWDYAGGRSLRLIIDRARGNETTPANPLPLDQAIVIAEKVALSLATMAELRDAAGNRLLHGALVPQFIWISDDGEIRVAGQQLGSGLVASLIDAKIANDIGRYFAMDYRTSGKPSKASEVYALGAVLFLLVTGQEPPDNLTPTVFASTMKAAKTMSGEPIPDDIRTILDKSLNLDPSARYASMAEMKTALTALANSGKYSATTFNLAFYLSNLLKKDLESEAVERDKESKVNVAAYLEAPRPEPQPLPASHVPTPAPFAAHAAQPQKKSKLPLAVAAVVVLGVLGGAAAMMLKKTPAPAAPQPVAQAAAIPAAVQPRVVSEPVVAAPATATVDPKAQEAAFELAVQQKLKEERDKLNTEMMRLQAQFTEELKRQNSKNAPVAAPPAQQVAEERVPSAAQLDAQRRESALREAAAAPVQQAAATPIAAPIPQPVQQQQPAVVAPQQTPVPAPAQPQVATVREGDVVDVGALDVLPRPTRPIRPQYPPIAARQKISASVIVSALISETGRVLEVRVLRGYPGFGINEAAIYAMKSTTFTAPMKEGKRVRTWLPQTMEFKP